MIRLGIDTSNLRDGGGVTHICHLLSNRESMQSYFNKITVWGGSTIKGTIINNQWLQFIFAPMLDKNIFYRTYWQRFKLPKIAKSECDILFIPSGNTNGKFQPYVTMSHTLLPFDLSEALHYGPSIMLVRILLLRLIQTRSFKKAAGVFFLTKYAQTSITKQIGKIDGLQKIIPHGIGENFYLAPREQISISNYSKRSPFRLLCVSIINCYKHQWHVADAVSKLRKDGLPVTIDFIGSSYQPSLNRFNSVRKRLDPSCQFINYHGPINYSELPSFYHLSDTFVFASSCENLPIILLEAMASGLPIACSNRGPMPEVLGDAGVYFDPENPEEIANALMKMIHDKELRENCAWKAFEKAQQYSWEKCAKETFGFISEVAKKHYNKPGID